MGLTSFKGELPCINDIKIAKNYLTAEVLKLLNCLVSRYFNFAETQALRHRPMYMEDVVANEASLPGVYQTHLEKGKGE